VKRNCRIVLITDNPINQLAPFADFVFCAGVGRDKESGIMDVSAPMHLICMLSRNMALKFPEKVAEFRATSLRRYEEFLV
jgi:DNA-binding MurR/RpiR family transcriptional regulator